MVVEWIYNFIYKAMLQPVIDFNRKAKKYKRKKEYGKIAIAFLLSLLYELALLFDLTAVLFLAVYLASKHIAIVCVVCAVIYWYWLVKVKYVDEPQKQEQTLAEDRAYEELKTYARNGYRDIRLIVFKTIQTVGEAIGIKKPRLLNEIETIDKFFINYGCVFYQFNAVKEDANRKFSNDELEDARKVLEDTFLELWSRGEFPSISMSTYTDNNGVILPPVSFVLVSDMGRFLEVLVTFTTPASVDFIKRTRQEKNATNNGYDKDDSRLL